MIIVRLSLALETPRDKVVFCPLSTYYGTMLQRAPDFDSRVWALSTAHNWIPAGQGREGPVRSLYLCLLQPPDSEMQTAWHGILSPFPYLGNYRYIVVQRARAHKGSIERCTHSLPGSVTSWMPACLAGPAAHCPHPDELASSSSVVRDLMVSLPARPERKR